MHYKHFGILLLLQVFLFIQCSTAETSDSESGKKNKIRNSFVDTNAFASNNSKESTSASSKASSAANIQSKALSEKNVGQQNSKRVEFGFNIGYLADLNSADLYKRVLKQIKQDGITNLRIYEPFTKNIIQKPGLASTLFSRASQAGFNILLCLSNYPDIASLHYNNAANSADQDQMKSFTNRRAPDNLDAYQSYLSNFLDDLQSKNLLQNVSFEIGNEPDAKRYFWGQTSDFIRVAKAVKQTLMKYNKPIYCCGFTSNFANASSSKSVDYYNFLNDNSFFDNINLSFHFYQDQNDITSVHLPRLNNSIITEFNLFSAQNAASVNKNNITNSPQFGSDLIKTLVFAYKNNIKKIYLFKLVDTPGKAGTFGFFDENGNPKASYTYFKDIFDAVRDGYVVDKNDRSISLVGTQETVLYAVDNNVAIPNKQIVSSSENLNANRLKRNEWVIFKN